MKPRYPPATLPKQRLTLTREQFDFIDSRTMPFLDANGMGKPLKHVVKEAYLQGLNDALDALTPDQPKTKEN